MATPETGQDESALHDGRRLGDRHRSRSIAVPPGVVVIVSHGLWRKLAIGGHVRAIAVFLRQARTYHRSDLT